MMTCFPQNQQSNQQSLSPNIIVTLDTCYDGNFALNLIIKELHANRRDLASQGVVVTNSVCGGKMAVFKVLGEIYATPPPNAYLVRAEAVLLL
jgi:hypothetical protein